VQLRQLTSELQSQSDERAAAAEAAAAELASLKGTTTAGERRLAEARAEAEAARAAAAERERELDAARSQLQVLFPAGQTRYPAFQPPK